MLCSAGTGPTVGAAAAAVTFTGGADSKMASLMSSTDSWRLLKCHAQEDEMPHLRELLADSKRCEKMFASFDGITLDYSRQARLPAARDGGAAAARRGPKRCVRSELRSRRARDTSVRLRGDTQQLRGAGAAPA